MITLQHVTKAIAVALTLLMLQGAHQWNSPLISIKNKA